MNKIERRTYSIRASQGDEFALVGRALTYNEISSNELATGLRERMIPGCFRESLASGTDVRAYLNHDEKGLPLGSSRNGTLKISDGSDGLDFRIELDRSSQFHRDVYAAVKRLDLAECSFAFLCEADDFSEGVYKDGTDCQIRNVRKAQLLDCSIVNSAFYGDNATSVSARSTATGNATLLAHVLAMPADWARQERAHRLGIQIAAESRPKESRGNEDFMSMRAEAACREKGLDYCSHDAQFVYASPADSDDEENCFRYSYELDDEGNLTLDEDSRQQVKHEISHSVRSARRERKHLRELKFRMEVASGLR